MAGECPSCQRKLQRKLNEASSLTCDGPCKNTLIGSRLTEPGACRVRSFPAIDSPLGARHPLHCSFRLTSCLDSQRGLGGGRASTVTMTSAGLAASIC